MKINLGKGKTKYGPGVQIDLSGVEVATAIDAYLTAHHIFVSGPRTISVNGELCANGGVYVDPDGFVVHEGEKYSGSGEGEMDNIVNCEIECWYLYPHRLTEKRGYRCHCGGECPAWCKNCKHECKITDSLPWCKKFELNR